MKRIGIIILLLLFFSYSVDFAKVKPLYQMFSDNKARDVNDLITIIVSEQAVANNFSTNNSSTQHQMASNFGPGKGGWQKAISLFGVDGGWKNSYKGDGRTSRGNSFKTTLSAKIINILPNGNFQIEGNKKIVVNGEEELIKITGEVRPDDISANNTIPSYKVANVEISYKGKGAMNQGAKPGILTRILNWIF